MTSFDYDIIMFTITSNNISNSGLKFLASRSGDAAEDATFFKEHPIYNQNILDGLDTLIQQYVLSKDPDKLAKVRLENIHAFQAFVVLCLRHTVGVMTWKLKHRKFKISDFFTVCDETLALLVLENNAELWRNKAYSIPSVKTVPKYMAMTKEGKARKEWSKEGKTRFNNVFSQLTGLRQFTLSVSNETELLKLWNTLKKGSSSRNGRVEDSVAGGDENVSVDDDDDEVIVVYEA